jgi:DnaD/phage-associated family protein
MARPTKQTVDYFPHYCNHKKTMFILEERYGNDGYAFWFKLLELLGDSNGHYYRLDNPANWEFLQAKTHLSKGKCEEILNLLATLEAIDKSLWTEYRVVWSDNFVEGVSDAYKNRRVEIPSKPHFYSQKPSPADVSTTRNPQTILDETILNETIVDVETTPQLPEGKRETGTEEPDAEMQSLVKFIANDFIPGAGPFQVNALTAWVGEGLSPELVIWAMQKACKAGVRRIDYVETILRGLHSQGISTVEAAEKAQELFKAQQGQGKAQKEASSGENATAKTQEYLAAFRKLERTPPDQARGQLESLKQILQRAAPAGADTG